VFGVVIFMKLWVTRSLWRWRQLASFGGRVRPNCRDEWPPGERLLQQELKQQQLRTTTQRVGEQLGSILAEFDRNGISGEDVKVLRAIRGCWESSPKRIWRKLCSCSSRPASPRTQALRRGPRRTLTPAEDDYHSAQSIGAGISTQQALYELSLRFKEFANRQSSFMWQAVQLAGKPRTAAQFLH